EEIARIVDEELTPRRLLEAHLRRLPIRLGRLRAGAAAVEDVEGPPAGAAPGGEKDPPTGGEGAPARGADPPTGGPATGPGGPDPDAPRRSLRRVGPDQPVLVQEGAQAVAQRVVLLDHRPARRFRGAEPLHPPLAGR